MSNSQDWSKEISNPFSTGGGGFHFESHVQASFVILMLAGGFVPCLPALPIKKIKLQRRVDGYNTDDLIVFMEKLDGSQRQKLLGQIKHSVNFTANDTTFKDVIRAAWRDYLNNELFIKRQDAIAVITGPLSASDIDGARSILEWARSSDSAEEFFRDVETAKFSSDTKRDKLSAFRAQLKAANNNMDLTDEQVFDFLRHFHILGYDLDVRSGVVLSLLHSLMNQYSMENVRAIWALVVDEVQNANKNAGTLSLENLPSDLLSTFRRQVYATIPATFVPADTGKADPNQLPHASTIALANLIGGWDENCEVDILAIASFVQEDFSGWISKLQEVLQAENSPVSLRDGKWHVVERLQVWESLGKRVFDKSLEYFGHLATGVLKERDPKLDLPQYERFGAALHGKVLSHSRLIRKGVAETLALMGADPAALANCSEGKIRTTTILSVREILKDGDWITWGSLNDLLPLLAEAAPEEFLSLVERDLGKDPCPFDDIFKQESVGFGSENYLAGLLWALEALAWDEKYLVQACVLLSELASRDPGGQSGNRPLNSLTTILLPWLPQTEASSEKINVAVSTIAKEQPNVAWNLLLSLLPKRHQTSMRSHRPTFKNSVKEKVDRKVSQLEYWQQITCFSAMALNLVNDDIARLTEFANNLDKLPSDQITAFLDKLASIEWSSKPSNETAKLWKKLKKILLKNQHSLLSADDSAKLDNVIKTIEPQNPAYQYQRLFGHNDPEFYSHDDGDWDEKAKKQELRRLNAIQEILEFGGIEAVRDFIWLAEEAVFVGYSLGSLSNSSFDTVFLPIDLMSLDRAMQQFLYGYVRGRFQRERWKWIEKLSLNSWSRMEIGKFLGLLPFASETWEKVEELLGSSDSEYWKSVNPNPFEASDGMPLAIDKLIENEQPLLALACLNKGIHEKVPFNVKQAEQALLALLRNKQLHEGVNRHDVVKVIKALQQSSDADPEVIAKIEWQFLPLIDRDLKGSPRVLELRLANSPEFFCEMVGFCYRSENEPREERRELTREEETVAKNAWTLLYDWRIPPGTMQDGSFSADQFTTWLEKTKQISIESGHLSIALSLVGRVLYYSPPDPDGLWIIRAIAEALNDRNADKLRSGFTEQVFNSRGAHWVDPTAKEEKELAVKYNNQANMVEDAGYQRFAAALRQVAQSYEREAERVIGDAKSEGFEDDEIFDG